MGRLPSAILTGLLLLAAGEARADWDDQPGFGFTGDFLVSAADAPCGVGTPPRGHFPPDIPTVGPFQIVTLTVRQDPNRLCYVFGQIAEAPVIRVRQGEDMFIKLRNEITDPGALDKLVVPGHLDDPNPPIPTQAGFHPVLPAMHHKATGTTNLHLHGLAVSPMAPQDETLKTCVDPAVGPARCGRREFVYHYRIDQAMPAGLYWYHPHVHGEVQAQMLMGLSGALIVEGPADDARRAAGIEDRVFVVRQSQDLDAPAAAPATGDAAGPGGEPAAEKPHARKRRRSGEQVDTADEMACSATTGTDELTLNGAVVLDGDAKDADLAHLEIGAGRKQLWRVLNAATDSFLDLVLVDEAGKPLPIAIAARDGVPLSNDSGNPLPPETTVAAQLVPPAGRLEFYVDAPAPGHKAYLVSQAVDTGCAGDKVPERRLAYLTSVEPAAPAVATAMQIPATPVATGTVPGPFTGLLARKTDRLRTIAFAEYPHPGSDDLNDFYIFERKPGAVLRPFEMDAPPTITVNAGTTEEWVVENWTNELHAFHIHQVHFRVIEVDGKPQRNPELLDVMTVPTAHSTDVTKARAPVVPGKIRIKLYFPPELAGDIPFHCHLVDHEDSGMMGVIRVLPPQTALQQKAELGPVDILGNPPICRSPEEAADASAGRP
ncbi:MAG TPA: multicopper oxidase domain-containing protein [Aliidongia sp.]|uniref:multicopper oxidase family protein n=1 Tax=Aliidongia sp. TaxID=1914230 RepID=UPI002DDCC096|nr:multicopper oxidase domain-containing protein [Aliidongia sp.]HEV2673312.1 multicopper oxidase domain-containing protein [Aliidongia sp.]